MLVPPPSAMKGDGRVMAHEYDRAADGSVCAVLDIREMRMVHGAHGEGQGLGAKTLIPSAASTAWAVDTLNKGPVLRSKIVLLQQDAAGHL
jgi:hypothetical protein